MDNLGLKEELQAADKRDRMKKLALYVLIFIVVLIWSAVGVFAINKMQQNTEGNSVSAVQEQPYPHAQLGISCSEAIEVYDARIADKEQQLADFSARVADDMAAISQQSQNYQNDLYSTANNAGPGINHDAVEDAASESREIVSDGLARVNQAAATAEQQMSDSIKEDREKRNELVTCERLTQEERTIPDLKVIEYEELISSLYSH